jgi:hypothetical protein
LICDLQLQGTHTLVTELSAVAAKESTLLNEYRELLATAAALQVQSWFLFSVIFSSFVLGSLAVQKTKRVSHLNSNKYLCTLSCDMEKNVL